MHTHTHTHTYTRAKGQKQFYISYTQIYHTLCGSTHSRWITRSCVLLLMYVFFPVLPCMYEYEYLHVCNHSSFQAHETLCHKLSNVKILLAASILKYRTWLIYFGSSVKRTYQQQLLQKCVIIMASNGTDVHIFFHGSCTWKVTNKIICSNLEFKVSWDIYFALSENKQEQKILWRWSSFLGHAYETHIHVQSLAESDNPLFFWIRNVSI
jgi:hypothetical protein